MIDVLDGLDLDEDQSNFLLRVWELVQFMDDVYDGDRPVDVYRACMNAFLLLPNDPFYAKHREQLSSLLYVAFLKWAASNQAEATGRADAKSFMWRAGYYDLVLFVFAVRHGPDHAMAHARSVLDLYGERLEEYLAEF